MEKIQGRLLDAVYVDTDQEVALYIETPNGRCQARIHRSEVATFGERTEEEIGIEMDKYVDMFKSKFIGKEVTVISDPQLEEKIKDGYPIRY